MKPDLNFSYLTKYVHGYLHEKTSITKRSRLSVALRYHNGGQNQSEDKVNKLLKLGLDQAKSPSTLEPIGLSRKGDRRRPDGLTYTTWKNGKPLIWDFTCADTLCKSYVKKASKEVGSAAAGREDKKVDKYSNLSDMYHFVPMGIETYGA